jgi:hypothetical protein
MKTFADLTKEEISGILNTAMDDGEWHTPSAHDINIHTQTAQAIYGWFNCSKHNTYHDQERWFNINGNNVQIWIKQYRRGKADSCLYKPIYNFKQLGEILESLSLKTTTL